MKILLIHAWNEHELAYRGRFSSFFSYPSLTLATLYSLIPAGMFDTIDLVDENSQLVDYDKTQYDVVLISADTSSAFSAYKHAAAFRKRGSYVAIGGYHATGMPEEVGEHCDTVLSGPAEIILPAFLHDWKDGHPKKFYRDTNTCAAEFPIPARDKVTEKRKLRIPGMIADRGCPNACKYCSMRVMWKTDPRPIEQVIDEIRSLHSKQVIFYDPNFFGKRDYALRLMKAMEPLKILWVSNATADLGYDHELMDAAYRSGCRGVLLGLESMSSASLRGVAKRFREPDKYKTIIENLHSHGIAVNGCFVLGFDSDTEEDLLALPERIEALGLDLCRFAVLTPYPGTKLFEELDSAGRITTRDWSRYNQHQAVFTPKNMSAERLNAIYRQVWKEAFTWKRLFRRVLHSPWARHWYGGFILGANVGFKFLGIDKEYKPR